MLFITLPVSILVFGLYIYFGYRRDARYLLLLLPGLPLSALINIVVKAPIGLAVGEASGYGLGFAIGMPFLLLMFYALLAPVTEEAIKISPLLVPAIRRLARPRKLDALWAGFALGISFGLGEAIYLAIQFNTVPQYADLPWYLFTGFLMERFLATFAHGVMTAIFTSFLFQSWGKALLGYLIAILMHFVLNAGAALLQMGLMDGNTVFLLLIVNVLVYLVIFETIRRRLIRREPLPETMENVVFDAEEEGLEEG